MLIVYRPQLCTGMHFSMNNYIMFLTSNLQQNTVTVMKSRKLKKALLNALQTLLRQALEDAAFMGIILSMIMPVCSGYGSYEFHIKLL